MDYLNINQAAKLTGLSIPTIRTKLERGMLPNATQIQEGKRKLWRIPESDLHNAGLVDKVSPQTQSDLHNAGLLSDIDRLERELAHTRELLERADKELEGYRERERRLYFALETRETQERRRFNWFRRNA